MDQNLKSIFKKEIKTVSDKAEILAKFDTALLKLSANKKNTEKIIKNYLPYYIYQYLKESNYINLSKITNLRGLIESIPVVELEIPSSFTQKAIDNLYSWTSENIENPVVLRFKVNHNLLAGVNISYKGRFFSAGIKKQNAEL